MLVIILFELVESSIYLPSFTVRDPKIKNVKIRQIIIVGKVFGEKPYKANIR